MLRSEYGLKVGIEMRRGLMKDTVKFFETTTNAHAELPVNVQWLGVWHDVIFSSSSSECRKSGNLSN